MEQRFVMKFGDTNFIGVANAKLYHSFVDEDWTWEGLLGNFSSEMEKGHLVVLKMTEEGIEHSWNVTITIDDEEVEQECFRTTEAYIKVTDHELYLVDYDCLTMAAQFQDNYVPDENCSQYKIHIENGIYRVVITQFYDVDNEKRTGRTSPDIIMNFITIPELPSISAKVAWCTY
jgi:hypothetical protein